MQYLAGHVCPAKHCAPQPEKKDGNSHVPVVSIVAGLRFVVGTIAFVVFDLLNLSIKDRDYMQELAGSF